jgi:hypothetical protein
LNVDLSIFVVLLLKQEILLLSFEKYSIVVVVVVVAFGVGVVGVTVVFCVLLQLKINCEVRRWTSVECKHK